MAAADAADAVRAGTVDVALLRLPADMSGLAVIALYEETTVAVVPTDHLFTAADEITAADLDDEPILRPLDDVVAWTDAPGATVDHRPETTEQAIELVASGMGALIVPQSLARLHHRKDLVYRPITDAPTCPVALVFPDGPAAGTGRGVHRDRARPQAQFVARPAEPAPKRTAREKTLAKQAARAAAGKVAAGRVRTERGRR